MRSLRSAKLGRIAIVIAAFACLWRSSAAWVDEPSPTIDAGTSNVRAGANLDRNAAGAPAVTSAAQPDPPREPKLRFQFRYQPWGDVLDWFARKADLSLVMDPAPQGTFNYSDDREYTPAEAIDVLNGVLLTKGYTLIRHGRMLMLHNLDDGVPDVPTVPLDDLPKKGEFELVRVLFNLEQLRPDEAQTEIQKLLGSQGSVVPLIRSRQVLVTGTAGRLRVVQKVLERIEGPAESPAVGAPQVKTYPIAGSDAQAVLSAVQLLFAAQADVRLTIDAKMNSLIAVARPAQQAKIADAIKQFQQEGQRIEVIRLMRVDPQTTLLAINRLFGIGDPAKGTVAGPQVEADLGNRQLMIRGTELQIAQIRELLEKLGERQFLAAGPTSGGRVRTLPLNVSAANSALGRIQEIWPTLRANELRIVGPSPVISNGPLGGLRRPNEPQESLDRLPAPNLPTEPAETIPTREESPAASNEPALRKPPQPAAVDQRSAALPLGARMTYIAKQSDAKASPAAKPPSPIVVVPGPNGLTYTSDDVEALDDFERLLGAMAESATNGREIAVFYLKHAQAAAVAQTIEQILGSGAGVPERPSAGSMAAPSFGNGAMESAGAARPAARRSRATTGDGTTTLETPNAGNPAGSGVSAVHAGIGRSVLATGPIKITSDKRLNALFVHANRADLNSIDRLLKVLDLPESPEDVALASKPRMIPVRHTRANEIAEILKQVYVDRMVENPNANQQTAMGGPMGAPIAAAFMRGTRGQPQPQGGSQRGRDDAPKLSIGVDTRSNAVVVAAPDSLFEEVRQLVGQLDQAAASHDQTVSVVAMRTTSLAAVGRAIEALGGNAVQIRRSDFGAGAAGSVPNAQPPAWLRGPVSQEQGNPPQSFPQRRGLSGGPTARPQSASPQP